MISVENDYESITYEEPFSSHIYENQLELLNNYYLGPISKTNICIFNEQLPYFLDKNP